MRRNSFVKTKAICRERKVGEIDVAHKAQWLDFFYLKGWHLTPVSKVEHFHIVAQSVPENLSYLRSILHGNFEVLSSELS